MNKVSRMMSNFSAREIQLDPGIWSRTSQIQLLYGGWVTMSNLAIGLGFGFAAVQVPQLLHPDSEIHITRDDASWIASMLLLFCPIGCMTSGFVMDRIGRRVMLIFSQVAMFLGWFINSFATTSKQIIMARAITGVGCGMAMSPPRIYCTEISLPNIRGVLGAFPNLAQSIGMTVQAALGAFFHWEILCYFCCFFTFANFCSYTMLPETPYFILQTKSSEQARINLAKFRGPTYNIDREMNELIDFKEDNNLRKLTVMENMGALCSKASCKPFWLITIYALIGQLAGNSCLMFWSIELLGDANSSFDAYTGNILLTMTRVVMGVITSILLYRFGRRTLALISAMGVSLVCFTIGVFLIYYHEPSPLPLICFMLYNVFASIGYYALPHLMAFELLPLQVRGILGGALVSLHCLLMFASTKMEPPVVEFLGVDYTFVTFGGFSLVGVIYLYFYLPETRDLTLQEIEEYYKDIRPTLVSQRRIMILSKSILAMQSGTKPKPSSLKVIRDPPSVKTSKTSLAAKLETKKQQAKLLEEGTKSPGRQTSSESQKTIDSRKSIDSRRSTDSRRSRVLFSQKDDDDEDNESIKSTKSPDIKRLPGILGKKEVKDDKDVQSIKSTDSKTSQNDETSKESKRSSKGGQDTPKDKDQASTSKKKTQ